MLSRSQCAARLRASIRHPTPSRKAAVVAPKLLHTSLSVSAGIPIGGSSRRSTGSSDGNVLSIGRKSAGENSPKTGIGASVASSRSAEAVSSEKRKKTLSEIPRSRQRTNSFFASLREQAGQGPRERPSAGPARQEQALRVETENRPAPEEPEEVHNVLNDIERHFDRAPLQTGTRAGEQSSSSPPERAPRGQLSMLSSLSAPKHRAGYDLSLEKGAQTAERAQRSDPLLAKESNSLQHGGSGTQSRVGRARSVQSLDRKSAQSPTETSEKSSQWSISKAYVPAGDQLGRSYSFEEQKSAHSFMHRISHKLLESATVRASITLVHDAHSATYNVNVQLGGHPDVGICAEERVLADVFDVYSKRYWDSVDEETELLIEQGDRQALTDRQTEGLPPSQGRRTDDSLSRHETRAKREGAQDNWTDRPRNRTVEQRNRIDRQRYLRDGQRAHDGDQQPRSQEQTSQREWQQTSRQPRRDSAKPEAASRVSDRKWTFSNLKEQAETRVDVGNRGEHETVTAVEPFPDSTSSRAADPAHIEQAVPVPNLPYSGETSSAHAPRRESVTSIEEHTPVPGVGDASQGPSESAKDQEGLTLANSTVDIGEGSTMNKNNAFEGIDEALDMDTSSATADVMSTEEATGSPNPIEEQTPVPNVEHAGVEPSSEHAASAETSSPTSDVLGTSEAKADEISIEEHIPVPNVEQAGVEPSSQQAARAESSSPTSDVLSTSQATTDEAPVEEHIPVPNVEQAGVEPSSQQAARAESSSPTSDVLSTSQATTDEAPIEEHTPVPNVHEEEKEG